MKNIISLILVFFSVSNINAQMQNQDSIFMANVWLLQKLEINQNIIPAPNNNELSFPKLTPSIINGEYQYYIESCTDNWGSFHFINNNELFIDDNYSLPLSTCGIQSNTIFSGIYGYDFLYLNILNNFGFIITDHTTYLELVITGQNGNKAYYHNNLSASLEHIIRNNVKVYPNPISDVFYIEADATILDDINEISIYDLSGKLVFKNKMETNNPINISKLSSGSYLLNFFYKNQLIKYGIILKK